MRKLIVLILFSFCLVTSQAQVYFTSGVDSLLREEFNSGRWKNVMNITDSIHKIDLGYHEAFEMAADAAYFLNKPFKQYNYLQHALQNFPTDSSILLKLANCYWATNQYSHANKLQVKLLKQGLLNETNKANTNLIHVDLGSKMSSNTSLYNNLNFIFIGSAFPIKSILTYHGITCLSQKSFYGSMIQLQYYSNTSIALKKAWKVNGMLHLADYNLTNYPSDLSGDEILSGKPYAIGLGISKLYKSFLLGVDIIKSNLNYKNQLQIISGISYYPFNNTKFILQVNANYLTEKSYLITSYQISYAPNKKMKIISNYLQANARNFTEQSAFLMHNSFDVTRNRYTVTATKKLSTSASISSILQIENKIETISNNRYQYLLIGIGFNKIF